MPSLVKVLILAVVQGLAELLPVSSSAHVVVAEKLMGLDPSSPEMTLVLVMLHTGTMFAVIFYFWSQWKSAYFATAHAWWAIRSSRSLSGRRSRDIRRARLRCSSRGWT
jgi:undecaprenyl pyrophosphate phosphatase UppP